MRTASLRASKPIVIPSGQSLSAKFSTALISRLAFSVMCGCGLTAFIAAITGHTVTLAVTAIVGLVASFVALSQEEGGER